MATVRFYGDLQRYGRKFKLDVLTAGEAIKALIVQMPRLRQEIQQGHYRVRIAGKDLHQEDLTTGMQSLLSKNSVIHIIPHTAGAKNGGIMSVVVGVAMIVAAFWTGGLAITAWTAAEAALAMSGAAMILSGTMMMLTKMPKMTMAGAENSKNTAFSNLDNTITQGQPIALCYGEMMIGSQVLSQGLSTI